MEEQSIFQTELSPISNGNIKSAAKWSQFLGIVFLVIAGIVAMVTIGVGFFMQSSGELEDVFSQMSAQNPQLASLEGLPQSIFIILIVIAIGFIIFMGILLVNIGKHGIAYASSNEDLAFVNTFKAAKTFFIVSIIMSILGIVLNLVSFF